MGVLVVSISILTIHQFVCLVLELVNLGTGDVCWPMVSSQQQQHPYDGHIDGAGSTSFRARPHGVVETLERGLPRLVGRQAGAGPEEPEELPRRLFVPGPRQQAFGDLRLAVHLDPAGRLVGGERRQVEVQVGAERVVVVLKVPAGRREGADVPSVVFVFGQGKGGRVAPELLGLEEPVPGVSVRPRVHAVQDEGYVDPGVLQQSRLYLAISFTAYARNG